MNTLPPVDAHHLADRLASLLGEERTVLVEFLRHLGQFDAEKGYAAFAYSSAFAYCTDRLRLSKSATFRRITTARLMRRFPLIAEFLADGRLCLTRVCCLKDVLTPENHTDLLARAAAGSEEDVEALVASIRPKPNLPDSIRKVPTRPAAQTVSGEVRIANESARGPAEAAALGAFAESGREPLATPQRLDDKQTPALAGSGSGAEPIRTDTLVRPGRMEVEARSATTWSVRMTVNREFLDEFEAVRAALSHKFPGGHFEDVLRECFRITLDACERRRCGSDRDETIATSEERVVVDDHAGSPDEAGLEQPAAGASESDPPSRYIPVKVRRAVWKRDGGRCAFVNADGKRCDSVWQLDFHHCVPFAKGGRHTVENVSLRCRTHNHHEAVLAFGAEFMSSRVPERALRATAAATSSLPTVSSRSSTRNATSDQSHGGLP